MTKKKAEAVATAVFSRESRFVHANLRDLDVPGVAVVLVSVGSPEREVEGGTRGGWVLTAYRRKGELVRRADEGRKEFLAKHGHANWWWPSWSDETGYELDAEQFPLPAKLYPHAAAFASGEMPPGFFADALIEEGAAPDDVTCFMLRPYSVEGNE